MKLSDLAAKQKRIQTWKAFLEEEAVSERLKIEINEELGKYQKCLLDCWESNQISEQNKTKINDMERVLTALNETARKSGNLDINNGISKP